MTPPMSRTRRRCQCLGCRWHRKKHRYITHVWDLAEAVIDGVNARKTARAAHDHVRS